MENYKIVIVDDHEVFRMGLKLLLSMLPNVDVVGEAINGKDFLDYIEKYKKKIDIVFMDIEMPVMNGIEATKQVLKKYPYLKIIAISTSGENELLDEMIYAGVEGFMLKNSSFNDFKNAIEKVTRGGNFFSEELIVTFTKSSITKKIKKEKLPDFTKREFEVLSMICKGYSNEKIGEKLFISDRTVERYKTNLIRKTNTSNTINLVLYALKNNLAEN